MPPYAPMRAGSALQRACSRIDESVQNMAQAGASIEDIREVVESALDEVLALAEDGLIELSQGRARL